MSEAVLNWPIIGHAKIVSYLRTSLKQNNLAPAYLLAGIEHLGKRFIADCLVLTLICQNKTEKPCWQCTNCQQYLKGIHPDIIVTSRADDKSNISVEQIRELRKRLSLHPLAIEYKISLIDPAEAMNKEAGNALLKILEEPVGPTIHLLISHESDSLLPTIKSRCQVLKLLPVSKKLIENFLKEKVGQDRIEEIRNLAMGRPGLVCRFIEDRDLIKNYNQESQAFLDLLNDNIASRLAALAGLLDQEYNFSQLVKKALGLLNNWQRVTRDLILVKKGNKNNIINSNLLDQLEKISQKISILKLLSMQLMLKEARGNLKLNVNPKLVLENFIINI